MEEKKLDVKSIIGFVLIFAILIFWFYLNQPTPEELEAQQAQQEQVEKQQVAEEQENTTVLEQPAVDLQDSVALANYQKSIGDFQFTPAREGVTALENDLLYSARYISPNSGSSTDKIIEPGLQPAIEKRAVRGRNLGLAFWRELY